MFSTTRKIYYALKNAEQRATIFKCIKWSCFGSVILGFQSAWAGIDLYYQHSVKDCDGFVSNYSKLFGFDCHFIPDNKDIIHYPSTHQYSFHIKKCEGSVDCSNYIEGNNVTTALREYVADIESFKPITFVSIPISLAAGCLIGLFFGYRKVSSAQWILDHEMYALNNDLKKIIFSYLDPHSEQSSSRIEEIIDINDEIEDEKQILLAPRQ